jgi:hypothetical protein
MLDGFRGAHILRVMAIGFVVSVLAAAAPCSAPGTRPGGGPSTSTNQANWNQTYVRSGQPGFGVSGPTDQDDPPADAADDACLTLEFNVPAAANKPQAPGGWGGLTLTFDRPIDGGSFVFDPVCPTPVDGTLGQVLDIGGEPTVGPNQSIVFKPTLNGRAYYALPTGTAVGKPKYSTTDFTNTQAPNFSQFAVTIMYDASLGVPQISSSFDGNPQSYWVGKPGKQNGGFTPYTGSSGPGTAGKDFLLASPVPEPSLPLLLLFGCVVVLIADYKRRVSPNI